MLSIVLNLQTEQFFFHFASDFLHAGTAVEVVHLGGVGLEVVEFPSVHVVVEVDELVTLIAHTVVTTHIVLGGVLVVVVVDALAPVLWVLAFEERHERNALNVGGYGGTGSSRKVGA